jgi:hypothetical protein
LEYSIPVERCGLEQDLLVAKCMTIICIIIIVISVDLFRLFLILILLLLIIIIIIVVVVFSPKEQNFSPRNELMNEISPPQKSGTGKNEATGEKYKD